SENMILQLYKLERNPFDLELQQELLPLNDDDLRLYAEVDGFARKALIIKDWFIRKENLKHTNFISIFGPKGSGRSSVANYVINRFSHAKGDSLERLFLIKHQVKDDHNIIPIRDALAELYIQATQEPGLQLHQGLDDLYMKWVFDSDASGKESIYKL